MTSRRSPISVTSWVMSSSIHGDSSALTRVHSAVEPRSISRPTRISPSRAASLRSIGIASSRLPSRMSVFVAMSAALATIFSLEKSRKWIIREGRSGISASGAGAPMASGLRKSRGLRMPGDDIDSPVNVCGGIPCGMRRVLLAALVVSLAVPAAAQAHRIRLAAPAQFDVSLAQVRYAVPRGRGRRCASRSPGRPAWTTWPSRCRATSPSTRVVALVAVVNRRPQRLAGAGSGPGPAEHAAVARHACARRHPGERTCSPGAPTPPRRPARWGRWR